MKSNFQRSTPITSFFVLAAISFTARADTWPEVVIESFAPVPESIVVPPVRPVAEAELNLASARASADFFRGLEITLTDAQRTALERDRFVLVPLETLPSLDPMEREPYVPESPEEAAYFPPATGGLALYEDEMLGLYGRIGGGGMIEPWRNHFVTTDSILHAWHRFFGNAVEEIETTVLHAKLDDFLGQWLAAIRAMRDSSSPELVPHWEQLEAQIAVAYAVLGDDGEEPRKDDLSSGWDEDGTPLPLALKPYGERAAEAFGALPERWRQLAADEVRLIFGKSGIAPSPLFATYDLGQGQDYSQFTPRSHYAKNQALRGYFRAMMYLGRNGWPLKAPDGAGQSVGLSHALLLAQSLASPGPGGRAPVEAWKEIFEITSFFAGGSDDVDYPELRRWLGGQVPLASWTAGQALDADMLKILGGTLGQLRKPGILSQVRRRDHAGEIGEEARDESLQFRVFGQRFSYDAWVLTELTPPLMTGLPATPTALYVAAALGDPHAREFALAWLEENGGGTAQAAFEAKLEDLARTIAAVPEREWFGSMAAKQLHLIGALAGRKEDGFPAFMRTPQWGAKHVETMLGSYTQLKHDTLLYAKQSYAEMGEGGLGETIDESTVPYGYVAPELRFWAELERLAVYAYEGFTKHRLLPNTVEQWGHLGRFKEDVAALRLLANKSGAGEKWTIEDRLWLLEFDPAYMAEPVNPMNVKGPDDGKTAIVADIQTNVGDNKVLYQGLGRPRLLLALVGDAGTNRLVAGTAYDYYEFTLPLEGRLGDEEWRKKFYRVDPEPQSKPRWTVPAVR